MEPAVPGRCAAVRFRVGFRRFARIINSGKRGRVDIRMETRTTRINLSARHVLGYFIVNEGFSAVKKNKKAVDELTGGFVY